MEQMGFSLSTSRALGAAVPEARDSPRPREFRVEETDQPRAGCRLPEVKKTGSGASFREKAGGRCPVCFYKQMQNVRLLALRVRKKPLSRILSVVPR